MAMDTIAAASAALTGVGQAHGVRTVDLGPSGAMAADHGVAAKFQASLDRAGLGVVQDMPAAAKGLFRALDGINVHAQSVSDYAARSQANGGQLTPGEIVQLTMQCQQFMFECQLTSNIANRSSDGVQQLFKQQG